MTSKQIDTFLRKTYGKDNVHKINSSGSRFMKKGIADYYIVCHVRVVRDIGWIEVKRGKEILTKQQEKFLRNVNGQVWRFYNDEKEIKTSMYRYKGSFSNKNFFYTVECF